MPLDYVGNPTATQAPGQQPYPGNPPTIELPVSGEARNIASLIQAFKEAQDYIAYLMQPGRMKVWREDYHVYAGVITSTQLPMTNYPALAVTINGAGSQADFSNTGDITSFSTYGANTAVLTAGGAVSRYANVSSPRAVYARANTATQLCFEQEVAIAVLANGDYRFGLVDSPTGLTHFAGLYHPAGSGVWQLVTDAGTFNITGSSPTAATVQRFKVIYYGAATPKGVVNSNTALIEVYLNDVLVLTQSGAFLTGGGATGFFALQDARATGAGGAVGNFGGWTISWNAY